MRGLREIVFSTTNQCTAHCNDCPVVSLDAQPRRLSAAQMNSLVDLVHGWGSLRLVVFTGGEAFLLGQDLRLAVAHAAQKGLFTRIVTNAYWATSRKNAVQILSRLKAAGLTEINISCDDYHQEFVPLERVKHANAAASEIGLPALLVHRRKPGGRITVDFLSEYLGVPLAQFQMENKNPDNNVVTSARNVPLDSSSQADPAAPWEAATDERDWRGACKSVLQSIVITASLDVMICCGIARSSIPELTIGSLLEDDLLTILQRGNRDLVANWLALEGPGAILDFVRAKDPEIRLPERFVNRCHVCNELFTRQDVRQILHRHASQRQDATILMRAALDWVGEDWVKSVEAAS